MKGSILIAAAAFALGTAGTAAAEIRFVLLRVEQGKNDKPAVQVQWDDNKAPGKAISLDEACQQIEKFPDSGSGVYVCLVAPKPVAAGHLKKLMEAIDGNHHLVLSYVSVVGDEPNIQNFLKQSGLTPK